MTVIRMLGRWLPIPLLSLLGMDSLEARILRVGPNSVHQTVTEAVQDEISSFGEDVKVIVDVPPDGYVGPDDLDVANLPPMNGHVIEIIAGSALAEAQGTVDEEFAYVDGKLVYKRGPTGMVFAHEEIESSYGTEGRIESGGGTYYYGQDHLGSTRVAFTEDETQSEALMYELYGGMEQLLANANGTVLQKFTGQEYDEDGVDFYQFTHRAYDPEIGIWGSPDPAYMGLNPYAYASQSPLNRVDFLGLFDGIPELPTKTVVGNPPKDNSSGKLTMRSFGGVGGAGMMNPNDLLELYNQLIQFQRNLDATISFPGPNEIVAVEPPLSEPNYDGLSVWDATCKEYGCYTETPWYGGAANLANEAWIAFNNPGTQLLLTMATAGAAGAPLMVREGVVLSFDNMVFTQETATAMFSNKGIFAGKSISDVARALRLGALKPSHVPVRYIVRDGQILIVETRSSLALRQAGVPLSRWRMLSRTGDAGMESDITRRLLRNQLTNSGTRTITITPPGGSTPGAMPSSVLTWP